MVILKFIHLQAVEHLLLQMQGILKVLLLLNIILLVVEEAEEEMEEELVVEVVTDKAQLLFQFKDIQ